jgi:hypothetical protein
MTDSRQIEVNVKMNRSRFGLAAMALLMLLAATSPAVGFEFVKGELTGNLDTTISYGATWRVDDPDPNNLGKAYHNPTTFLLDNAGQRAQLGRWSVNNDDGNRKWEGGDLVSNVIKLTSELDVRYRNFGGFIRFSAFYDFENHDRADFSQAAKDRVGKDFRLLDAYIWGDHTVGDSFLTWRLGQQVVSWGESTFIQGGINVINPVDVSKLRIAGAELKEAFDGVNMLWATMDITESWAIEGLYMFDYERIIPDPAGTYWSTNDIATPGASYGMLNFGTLPQPVLNPDLFDTVCLQGNYTATDIALPPDLIFGGCQGAITRIPSVLPSDSGQYGLALRWFLPQLDGTEFGFYYLNYHSRLPLISGYALTTAAPSSLEYFTEYPEDIELFGASFNSNVGLWSLSGEVSYRPDAPLQFDDVEILFAGLTPLNPLIPAPVLRFESQLGDYQPGEYIKGWDTYSMTQAQLTTTKVFGPHNIFKAGQLAFVAEIGANYISDLPSKDFLRFNGEGTDTGGGPDFLTGNFRNPETEPDGFADDFSWGYRMLLVASYYDAIGAWNVIPRLGWSHDVDGTTPGPGGSFIEDRKQLTLGVTFDYLQRWDITVSYTDYFGGSKYNELRDRDFISASVSYSF